MLLRASPPHGRHLRFFYRCGPHPAAAASRRVAKRYRARAAGSLEMTAGAGGGPGGRRVASLSLSAVGQRTRAGAVRRRGFPLSRPSSGNTLRTILSPPLSVNAAHKRSSVLAASLSIQHTRVFSLSHVCVYVLCVHVQHDRGSCSKNNTFPERRACKCQSTKKHGQSLYTVPGRVRACTGLRLRRLSASPPRH